MTKGQRLVVMLGHPGESLGLKLADYADARLLRKEVHVFGCEKGSPAQRAGVIPGQLLEIEGNVVESCDDVERVVVGMKARRTTAVKIVIKPNQKPTEKPADNSRYIRAFQKVNIKTGKAEACVLYTTRDYLTLCDGVTVIQRLIKHSDITGVVHQQRLQPNSYQTLIACASPEPNVLLQHTLAPGNNTASSARSQCELLSTVLQHHHPGPGPLPVRWEAAPPDPTPFTVRLVPIKQRIAVVAGR